MIIGIAQYATVDIQSVHHSPSRTPANVREVLGSFCYWL